jgi:hypothetical protein
MVRRGISSFRVDWYWIILVGWRLLRLENLGIRISGDADGDMPFMEMKLLRLLWFESRPNRALAHLPTLANEDRQNRRDAIVRTPATAPLLVRIDDAGTL